MSMKQQFVVLLPLLSFISLLHAQKLKSRSTGNHWQFSSSRIFSLEDSSGDAKKWEEQWNKKRSRLAQCKHNKYVKCPSVMARVRGDSQMRAMAEKALKEKRGQNIFILRFKSQKKGGLEMAKMVLSAYFALVIKKGITCSSHLKRCDTKRYRHQYLPFQIAYAYNSVGDCAFEYGETIKGRRKGGFGVRMLCLSKNTMTGELYPVGKSCSACQKKCGDDSLCDGAATPPPSTRRSAKSNLNKKSKKDPNISKIPTVNTKNSHNKRKKDKKSRFT